MHIYDNFSRNLNKCWVILATENLLTTKVTCEFLVNTVLPLIRCRTLMESPDQGASQMSLGDSYGAPKMSSAKLVATTSSVSIARMTAPL